jgi:dihydrofolate reductase
LSKISSILAKLFVASGLCRWLKGERVANDITYSYVLARAKNGVIGCNNQLPWRLPSDLRKFKSLTLGKPLVMGRRTFESIGRALPGRTNIVISRDNGVHAEGVHVFRNKDDTKRFAETEASRLGVTEVMVIGGAEIFQLFRDEVETVYLTEIDAVLEGDAYFKDDFAGWTKVDHKVFRKGQAGDQYDFDFFVYRRPDARVGRHFRCAAE